MPLRIGANATRINDPATNRSRTGTHLSTNILIYVDGVAVSAVTEISIEESRQIKQIDEIGTDGHIDSAPSSSTSISGSIKRTRFDRQRIAEAFMRGFVHVAAQRVPFDIQIQDNFTGEDGPNLIITTLRNVWIKSISSSYSADNFIIVDSMTYEAESVDSIRANGENVVGPSVNNRGVTYVSNPFEREADRGKYRGALDAANLISAFDGSTG